MIKEIFIEIPSWLGDAIMATPAIDNLIITYPDAQITLLGSFVSTQAFQSYPNIKRVIVDDTKKSGNRYKNLISLAKSIERVDLAISFRRSISSKFMMFFIKAKKKFNYRRLTKKEIHLCIRYNDFVNKVLNLKNEVGDLKLYFKPFNYGKPTLGINPGATYGSAKRWYPEEFAKIAIEMSKKYDIVIFGGPAETNIAKDIENELVSKGITNYQNLAGKTTIPELIEKIAGLDLFITNDSGPMHIAAAYKVKTVAIFGPTKFTETNQWNNPNGEIVTKNLDCAPCMKRVCPLKHHNCMKNITAADVLNVIVKLEK
ncbi:glycosyltransferase family 9 protein [Aliarcobacter butzleri]|uniref:Glycosyltransferase family 9 protein n=1 Tax=Aliarcobacter butzleri TaxID=28197 RepID=A0AAP4PXB2_9BACT|nr:glycosyltransferase family 9 protein [Aliarcobacter butzleri]MCG3709073.1 glycosyltransferase family 9 protein [Aliarcobacter butzleri]MDN5051620.1 glycosyltransferase family 9 protein [Aliarcobacter butzleri]MDN5075062.1 glycosyltransferase family 9 protein [Aliarcobacter butzleri]MDN5116913.1 glycosyltransferase family 9 protein [Aliarcobacter butzleri]MDN5131655.1 glycosyltransferase family 9 protein [Aliarcobacter butzleri]